MIRAVDLVAIAAEGGKRGERCDVFWGGHGCNRLRGHEPPHACGVGDPDGLCSIHDGVSVWHVFDDELSKPSDMPLYRYPDSDGR